MTKNVSARAEELADSLRRLLEKIDAGELDARPGLRNRVEGALVALEALLKEPNPGDG